ncbi:hypothetical protein [Roseovarius autotrophicus]|uniref:hypothetical protein n=1 Tax=Roseovarius autotrophicus TaxID=2824121 RepID=UPI001FFC3E84|nr:hypothetical protein [Roseovarius autotrophicus]
MSTRAQIAIQLGPEEWAHTYVHYDGYPSHMLPALAPWTPEDILAAIEIRQVRPMRSKLSTIPATRSSCRTRRASSVIFTSGLLVHGSRPIPMPSDPPKLKGCCHA